MINKPSLLQRIAFLVLVIGATIISSCGTQRMGCPGSISQTERATPSHG
ncbi:MAG: hypothetical protein H0W62_07605 [Chitinophagales bacterium]|nr:hypothetical protein [Chitinophagales bacterium]